MQVVIENITRAPLTLVLPHGYVCSESKCICSRQKVMQVDHNPKTGDLSSRASVRRLPHAVQLFAMGRPGSTSEPLPRVVDRCPDVARALRERRVRLVEQREPEPVVAPPEPPVTPSANDLQGTSDAIGTSDNESAPDAGSDAPVLPNAEESIEVPIDPPIALETAANPSRRKKER